MFIITSSKVLLEIFQIQNNVMNLTNGIALKNIVKYSISKQCKWGDDLIVRQLLERLNLNINYQSWSSYLYFSGKVWVLISNSIKRENCLGNQWVIGWDRNHYKAINFMNFVEDLSLLTQWVTPDVQKSSVGLTKLFYSFHLNWDVLSIDSPIHSPLQI